MAKYAIVESGTVTNIIEWDGSTPHADSAKFILSDANAYIGGAYDGSSFSAQPAAADNRTYVEKRAAAYASIGDQLDMQYHDAVNGTTTWRTHIAAVKAAHPKS
jgi:hypothetical protein